MNWQTPLGKNKAWFRITLNSFSNATSYMLKPKEENTSILLTKQLLAIFLGLLQTMAECFAQLLEIAVTNKIEKGEKR